MQTLLSSLCSCLIPKTENFTLKIEYTDKCINEKNYMKYQTNIKSVEKNLSTSINPINNIKINNKYNNCLNTNLLDNPFNNSFNCSNLSNASYSPCNMSSMSSLNSQKYKKLISKNKMIKKYINENEIFNTFQNNVDNIINEIKEKRTISESDDSEMCFSK